MGRLHSRLRIGKSKSPRPLVLYLPSICRHRCLERSFYNVKWRGAREEAWYTHTGGTREKISRWQSSCGGFRGVSFEPFYTPSILGRRYSRAGARDKRAARASRIRDYSSAFRFRCVRGTGAGACAMASSPRPAHAQSQSRHDHRRCRVVRSDEPWRDRTTLEGVKKGCSAAGGERCSFSAIVNWSIQWGPVLSRAVHTSCVLYGAPIHSTRNQNPVSPRSLPFCALPSALASPCSGGLACLRRSNALGRNVPLCHVTRIVVPFFTRWVGRPSFRAHSGHSAAKISFSSASCCAVLRFAAFKLIVRPSEYRCSFVATDIYSFDEISRRFFSRPSKRGFSTYPFTRLAMR